MENKRLTSTENKAQPASSDNSGDYMTPATEDSGLINRKVFKNRLHTSSLNPQQVIALQRSHGNQFVQRLIASSKVQRCACGGVAEQDGKCKNCREKEEREAKGAGRIQRLIETHQGNPTAIQREGESGNAQYSDDPNFLLCLALCELGVPPSLWRTAVNLMLQAASEEYGQRLGATRGSAAYHDFQTEFQSYSTFNKLKLMLGFIAEGRVAPGVVINHAAAQAIRNRCISLIERVGVSAARLTAASQIIRKVSLYIELAYAAGCAGYCGGVAYGNTIIEFSTAAFEAIASMTNMINNLGQAISTGIARSILTARARLNPANWDTTPLGSSALALQLVGNAVWARVDSPDLTMFATNISRPMGSFNLPANVVQEIATAMSRTASRQTGFSVTFTPTQLTGLTYRDFVEMLLEWHLLNFQRNPEQVAEEELNQRQQQGNTP